MRTHQILPSALALLVLSTASQAATSLLDSLTPNANATVVKAPDGLRLSPKKPDTAILTSKDEFKVPLTITARVKTSNDNIRLFYGNKGVLILDWESNGSELRHHDPKTGKESGVSNQGAIPKDTFATIEWNITPTESRVSVDGVLRASFKNDYSALSGNVGIGTFNKSVLTIKSFDVSTAPAPRAVPVARASGPLSIDVDVPCEKPSPGAAPPATAPSEDPGAIERPEYRNTPKPLVKSLATVTALMVRLRPDGEAIGFTSDIIATVSPQSRRSDKAGAGFYRVDGDPSMKAAFEDAIRAVTVRYPLWEPGHIDYSFGEKSQGHGGPSAGTAFALLALSTLEGWEIDPRCAVTGDITADWKVRAVGGVTAKLRGAFVDNCLYAVIPDSNEIPFADMGLLEGHHAWWDLQVFSIATLQQAQAVVRQDRSPQLTEAVKLFADLQPQLTKAERLTLQKPDTKATLQHILDLAPNHLSAKYLLEAANNTAPSRLSLAATDHQLALLMAPYSDIVQNGEKYNRQNITPAVTAQTRKKLDTLRPIAAREYGPMLTNVAAFIETLDSYLAGRTAFANLRARAEALHKQAEAFVKDKDVLEKSMREGY